MARDDLRTDAESGRRSSSPYSLPDHVLNPEGHGSAGRPARRKSMAARRMWYAEVTMTGFRYPALLAISAEYLAFSRVSRLLSSAMTRSAGTPRSTRIRLTIGASAAFPGKTFPPETTTGTPSLFWRRAAVTIRPHISSEGAPVPERSG